MGPNVFTRYVYRYFSTATIFVGAIMMFVFNNRAPDFYLDFNRLESPQVVALGLIGIGVAKIFYDAIHNKVRSKTAMLGIIMLVLTVVLEYVADYVVKTQCTSHICFRGLGYNFLAIFFFWTAIPVFITASILVNKKLR
jgi:hypothetical protein